MGEYCNPRIPTLHQCARTTAEALVGGITGALASPATLLLARYDAVGHLRLIARTTPLPSTQRRGLAQRPHPADPDHPWHGRRFSTGSGTPGELDHHPVRFLRLRDDLAVQQVPPFGT